MCMKNFSKIFMSIMIGIVMSLLTSSCAKDDIYQQKIVGEWKITRVVSSYYENGKEVESNEEQVGYNGFVVKFKSDGTIIGVPYGEESEQNAGTWKIEGGKLLMTEPSSQGNSEPIVLDIVELNKSSLVLSVSYEWEDDGSTCKSSITVYFERI